MTKRGQTLELAVLGLLHDHPMHGYQLRKELNAVLGWGRVLSYGSLYPALKRMLRAGWIAEDVAPREDRREDRHEDRESGSSALPLGSAASRRQRITYHVTPDGTDRFTHLMSDAGPSSWEDDVFDVRFAFFGRTEREIRLRILEGRRTRLEERLARVKEQLAALADNGQGDGYTAKLQRHGLESVQSEVRWLSELIDAERGQGASP